MKIARVETFLLAPRWLFCRVESDDGHVGWGEPVLEGRAETVRTAVHELADVLVGQDPRRIEDLWHLMTRGTFYRGGPVLSSAVAGIDQALWDMIGKLHDVPVYELLGGPVRERVRTYAWVGGDEPSQIREHVAERLEQGFRAVKMNGTGPYPVAATRAERALVVQRAAAAREVLGEDRDVALDFHGRVGIAEARWLLPALEDIAPLFVEEPIPPEYAAAHLAALVAATSVPLAMGERAYSRWDVKPLLDAGIAVIQPDLSHAGGISEVRRIANLAEIYGVQLAPHCPLGPLALAASLQVCFAVPNVLIQEHGLDIHYNAGPALTSYVLDDRTFAVVDGHLPRPTGAGLGVEIDEDAVRAGDRAGHRWRNPIWRDADGAYAEW